MIVEPKITCSVAYLADQQGTILETVQNADGSSILWQTIITCDGQSFTPESFLKKLIADNGGEQHFLEKTCPTGQPKDFDYRVNLPPESHTPGGKLAHKVHLKFHIALDEIPLH